MTHRSPASALSVPVLLLALAAGPLRAQDSDPVPPAQLERATEARIDAGATRVAWVCVKGPDGAVRCLPEAVPGAERPAVGFGDGEHGARLPVGDARPEAAAETGGRIAPSQRKVVVMPALAGATDTELAAIGAALAADPSAADALGRWRALVERELRAGRDPTRLVPRLLEEALRTAGSGGVEAQAANLDLQDALQRQQQTLQTLSNVAKAVHDTQMAVIRKMGG